MALVAWGMGCGGGAARITGEAEPGGAVSPVDVCHEETNRYRARVKRPPFRRSAALDRYAAEGAAHDAARREPHHHFNTVAFPDSFSSFAENELPWWHLGDGDAGAAARVIRTGIASMWAEGAGGGHYENLVGPFAEMGCGVFVVGDEITLVQNFRSP